MTIEEDGSVPARDQIEPANRWDLSPLFRDDGAWEKGLREVEKRIQPLEEHRGRIRNSMTITANAPSATMPLAFLYLRPEQSERLWSFEHQRILGDPFTVEQESESGLQDPEQLPPDKGEWFQCI